MTNKELFKALCEKIAEGNPYDVAASRDLTRDILTFRLVNSETYLEIDFSSSEISIYTY